MSERRRVIAVVVFVLDVLGCGIWAYRESNYVIYSLSGTGSGGIAGFSAGVLEVLFTVAPPIVTIWLARSWPSRLARWWRNAHLAAMLALVIVPTMASLHVMILSLVLFWPVQVFFVVGALAIWIANPRRRPDTPAEASS
jgi:uncharacterized membrane protein YtjA (UPF0391 family)